MKKHKSVVSILLAVMMIFAMMPSMAFAAKATGWDAAKDYATVTDANGDTYVTERHFTSDKMISATATAKKVGQAIGESDGVAPSVSDTDTTPASKYFYQLDGSALVYEQAADKVLDGTTWAYTAFKGLNKNNLWVKVAVPSYTEEYDKTTAANNVKFISLNDFVGWKAEVKMSDYDEEKKSEDQKITVSIEFTPNGEITGSATAPEKLGVVASATITVKGTPLAPKDAKFYFDAVGGADLQHGFYDGAAHTVVADEVPGYTVSYEVYNESTGKWDAVSAVSINDVLAKPMKVRATFKKGNDSQPMPEFNVNLQKADVAHVGFEKTLNLVKGNTFNAADYVIAYSVPKYDKDTTPEAQKPIVRMKDAATEKAVAANEKDLIAYCNELYDVVETVDEYNPNLVKLSFDTKDLTSKQKDELAKKYKAVVDRFDGFVFGKDITFVALNGVDPTDYEIEFTEAPAKKVIKTKKAKSTKKVTFNVKAECKNGTLVKYKLINAPKKSISIDANTGKITVKKGLAKGTYTFKVKAYIPASRIHEEFYNGSTAVSEIQTVKVVVKKTKK